MYILLLAWRYLRTRFIALASVVSVTLGVATLIVVNSVMCGFVHEMYIRLHGVLSDIDISSTGMGEIYGAQWRINQLQGLVGDDLVAATGVIQVPALLQFELPSGRPMSQQIMLIGIDEATYGKVADFEPFLKNASMRQKVDFLLKESGYDPELGNVGWPYRRREVAFQRQFEASWNPPAITDTPRGDSQANRTAPVANAADNPTTASASGPAKLVALPDQPPNLSRLSGGDLIQTSTSFQDVVPPTLSDPYAAARQQINPEPVFDPMVDQYTGIILGLAIANRQFKDPKTGELKDIYLLRPGDDVQIMLPTAGNTPSAITQNCTVVDFYHSKMHEYDANFAFMPLTKLQQIRGMIEPQTGVRNVTAIQLKVREGANLEHVKEKLSGFFPPDEPPFLVVQSWMDQQRPLLSAVTMELTILNILLFMIIAVAGFGILATFYMIVVEKTKDIGILKVLGASRRGVMGIFLAYGLSLGAVGAGAGIVLGLLFVVYINRIADLIRFVTGREVFDPTMYFFNDIPTVISPVCVIWVAVGAMLIAVLASVLPALRAARLNPVEALRYE